MFSHSLNPLSRNGSPSPHSPRESPGSMCDPLRVLHDFGAVQAVVIDLQALKREPIELQRANPCLVDLLNA